MFYWHKRSAYLSNVLSAAERGRGRGPSRSDGKVRWSCLCRSLLKVSKKQSESLTTRPCCASQGKIYSEQLMTRETIFIFRNRRRYRHLISVGATMIALLTGIALCQWAKLPLLICAALAIVAWVGTVVLWQLLRLWVRWRLLRREEEARAKHGMGGAPGT